MSSNVSTLLIVTGSLTGNCSLNRLSTSRNTATLGLLSLERRCLSLLCSVGTGDVGIRRVRREQSRLGRHALSMCTGTPQAASEKCNGTSGTVRGKRPFFAGSDLGGVLPISLRRR